MCSSDEEAQSKHYSGWKSDTFVNNILMFAPTGKITFAVINAPGSWQILWSIILPVEANFNVHFYFFNEMKQTCLVIGFRITFLLWVQKISTFSQLQHC